MRSAGSRAAGPRVDGTQLTGASEGFYRDVLGLKFLFSAGPNLAFRAAGNLRLMLTAPEGAGSALVN